MIPLVHFIPALFVGLMLSSCAHTFFPSGASRLPVLATPTGKGSAGLQVNGGLFNNSLSSDNYNPSFWLQAQSYYGIGKHVFVEMTLAGAYSKASDMHQYGGFAAPGVGYYTTFKRLSLVASTGFDLGTSSLQRKSGDGTSLLYNLRYYGMYVKAGVSVALGKKDKVAFFAGLQLMEGFRVRQKIPFDAYQYNFLDPVFPPGDRVLYYAPHNLLVQPILGLRFGKLNKINLHVQYMPFQAAYFTNSSTMEHVYSSQYLGLGLTIPLHQPATE